MKTTNPRILWLAAGLALLAGCSDNGTEPQIEDEGEPTPTYAADIQPIFDSNCAGCHGDGGNGGLDLRGSVSYGNLVATAAQGYAGFRVVPNEPDESILYRKLSGSPGVGSQMPPTGVLPAATVQMVRDWILAGARDD